MPKLTKKLRRELERSLTSLNAGIERIEKSQGFAQPIASSDALGSDYLMKNPRCVETCQNKSEAVRVISVFGSDVSRVYRARDIITNILNEYE